MQILKLAFFGQLKVRTQGRCGLRNLAIWPLQTRFAWRFMISSTLVCADTLSAITAVAVGGRERELSASNLNQMYCSVVAFSNERLSRRTRYN